MTGSRAQLLEEGRKSFQKQSWGAAFAQLAAADLEEPLEAEDVVLLAQAALLTGREAEGADLLRAPIRASWSAGMPSARHDARSGWASHPC